MILNELILIKSEESTLDISKLTLSAKWTPYEFWTHIYMILIDAAMLIISGSIHNYSVSDGGNKRYYSALNTFCFCRVYFIHCQEIDASNK